MKLSFIKSIVLITAVLMVLPMIANAQTEIKVLFLGNNTTQAEFPVVSGITEVENYVFDYTLTQDNTLADADAENYDILWLGQGEISENGYRFTEEGEQAVLSFVDAGGVAITVEQDSDDDVGFAIKTHGIWMPEQLKSAERPGTDNFNPTADAGDIFDFPEKVNVMHCNDKWHDASDNFTIMADDGAGYILLGTLLYGEGMYIITSLQNENAGQAQINVPIMTNILYMAAQHAESVNPVEAAGKMATTWAGLKSE